MSDLATTILVVFFYALGYIVFWSVYDRFYNSVITLVAAKVTGKEFALTSPIFKVHRPNKFWLFVYSPFFFIHVVIMGTIKSYSINKGKIK